MTSPGEFEYTSWSKN